MKIISYNIQFGRGIDGEVDLVRTCRAIRGADLICLQEVDQFWRRSGDLDQAAEIAGLMPTYYYVFGSSFDVDASSRAAHGAVVNRRRRHGNLILSRWPITSSRTFNLPKTGYARRFNMQMGFIEAVIDTGTRRLRVYNCHAGYLDGDERLAQMSAFARIFNRSPAEGGAWSGDGQIRGDDWSNGRAAPEMPMSAIVCGDFNANFATAEYRQLLAETGLVDCFAASAGALEDTPTWKLEHTDNSRHWGKIDQVFVTPDLGPALESVAIDLDTEASDHTPLQVTLNLG